MKVISTPFAFHHRRSVGSLLVGDEESSAMVLPQNIRTNIEMLESRLYLLAIFDSFLGVVAALVEGSLQTSFRQKEKDCVRCEARHPEGQPAAQCWISLSTLVVIMSAVVWCVCVLGVHCWELRHFAVYSLHSIKPWSLFVWSTVPTSSPKITQPNQVNSSTNDQMVSLSLSLFLLHY